MPLASYDSATGKVSLLVTPETSGVAMELLSDVMENYVRRDGAGDPTFYDGATVTLGAGATLEWNNNDGQILGVSLLKGNNLAIQQIDTLSFGTGALSLSQASPGELQITGSSGSLYVSGPNLSSSTGDLRLESNTIIATGDRLYIGDKTDPDTYYLHTTNGEIRMENSTGYASFKRTGDQLQIDTDASEIYLGKNLRVSRVYGTADHALTADNATNANYATSAGNANTVGGKTWSDIQSYVQQQAASGGSFILEVNTSLPINNHSGYLAYSPSEAYNYKYAPNAYVVNKWYSYKDLGRSDFFPNIYSLLKPYSLYIDIASAQIEAIYVSYRLERKSAFYAPTLYFEAYKKPIGSTSSTRFIYRNLNYNTGSRETSASGSFIIYPRQQYEYKFYANTKSLFTYYARVTMYATKVVFKVKTK
jgi:hypothetical protein